jgi:hypothetical protein
MSTVYNIIAIKFNGILIYKRGFFKGYITPAIIVYSAEDSDIIVKSDCSSRAPSDGCVNSRIHLNYCGNASSTQ